MQLLFKQSNRKLLNENRQPFSVEENDKTIFYYTYIIHCIPTDQYYVGQRSVHKHPLTDNYKGSGKLIKQLKEKYDWFNDFEVFIVQCYKDRFQLAQAEQSLITEYQNKYKDKCLNISNDLQVSKIGRLLSEDHKQKFKDLRSTEEYKKDQSKRMKQYRFDHPEFKEQFSLMMKDKWQNDEQYKKRMKEVAIENSIREKQLYKEHPELIYREGFYQGQALITLEDFTSPMNGRFFKAGTVFQSTQKASIILGFSHMKYMTSSIINHKSHPWEWRTKIDKKVVHVTTFRYVSDLTESQLKQFNIDPNNLTFVS